MASAEELRQQLATNRAAFREALSALSGKWELPAPDDEWTPRRVAEHAIGAEVMFATRCFEAMQSKPSDWERLPLETPDAATARLDAAAAVADRAYRYVEDHDLQKPGNPGGDYPKTVEGILLSAINHLSEHAATLRARA